VTLFGSDLYVDSFLAFKGVFLNETKLSSFLEEQTAFDGAVAGFGYQSIPLDQMMQLMTKTTDEDYGVYSYLSDLTGYNNIFMSMQAIPQNYLQIVDDYYYYPNDFQPGIQKNKTNG
jgi:hypothetical protein